MAKLTTAGRKQIASKNFALPGRRYPIENISHGRNALARAAQHASPAEQATIKRKVHARYPSIGEKKADPPKQKRHFGSMAPVSGKYPKYGAGHYLGSMPTSDEEE